MNSRQGYSRLLPLLAAAYSVVSILSWWLSPEVTSAQDDSTHEFIPLTQWLPYTVDKPGGIESWQQLAGFPASPPLISVKSCSLTDAPGWCQLNGPFPYYVPIRALAPLQHRLVLTLSGGRSLQLQSPLSTVDSNTSDHRLQLARSLADALAGTILPISDVGSPTETCDQVTLEGKPCRLKVIQTFGQRGYYLVPSDGALKASLRTLDVYIMANGHPLEVWKELIGLLRSGQEDVHSAVAVRVFAMTSTGAIADLSSDVLQESESAIQQVISGSSFAPYFAAGLSQSRAFVPPQPSALSRLLLLVSRPEDGRSNLPPPQLKPGILGPFSGLFHFTMPAETALESLSYLRFDPTKVLQRDGTWVAAGAEYHLVKVGGSWPAAIRWQATKSLERVFQETQEALAAVERCNTGPELLVRGANVLCLPFEASSTGRLETFSDAERRYSRVVEFATDERQRFRELVMLWNEQDMRAGVLRTIEELEEDIRQIGRINRGWSTGCSEQAISVQTHLLSMLRGNSDTLIEPKLLRFAAAITGRGQLSLLAIPRETMSQLTSDDCSQLQLRLREFLSHLSGVQRTAVAQSSLRTQVNMPADRFLEADKMIAIPLSQFP